MIIVLLPRANVIILVKLPVPSGYTLSPFIFTMPFTLSTFPRTVTCSCPTLRPLTGEIMVSFGPTGAGSFTLTVLVILVAWFPLESIAP